MAALLLVLVPTLGRGAETKPSDTSLSKVPADAEAYGACLRLGETLEIIGKSRAWKLIWNEPAIQDLWKKARAAYDNEMGDWAAIKKFLADPANKDLPALAADALSQEVFVYAGAGWGDLLALGQELIGGARYGPAFQKLVGGNADNETRARVRIILQTLAEKPERLRIPDLVIGFKVSDPAKVTAQLKRLDPLLATALKDTPLKGRSERVRVAGDEFLVLRLDGSLVPWDDLPLGMFEDKPGEFAPLIAHLKKMKLSVAVGVRQGYLLIALGASPDQLARFGGEGPKLAGRPEFKPLAKFADRPLTSIGYTSAKMRQATATTPEDVAGFADLAKAGLKQLDLPNEQTAAIEKDIDALAAAIGRGLKKPGSDASFSFRTPQGWETYAYDYTDPQQGEQRPLTLLNHLGSDPLLAAVWRSGTTIEDYRTLVKWVTMFGKHAEKIVEAKIPTGEEYVKLFRKEFVPLLSELNGVTEKLWLPALADGQEAFVLDAKWTSKRWHATIPEADAALPMLELGIVLGVSDAAKLEQALEGYRVAANKLIAKALEQFPPGAVPEFQIPKPRVERRGGNTFAHFPIPKDWGIDGQFLPTGGLSKKVAVLALSRGHAERLLDATPLKTGSTTLKDLTRPLDSIFYCNWAGLVDAAAPWVQHVIRREAVPAEREKAEQVAHKVIRVLKVFRSYTSVTYREGTATVTHSEAIFRDIEPEAKK